jgi:hypothetical protein
MDIRPKDGATSAEANGLKSRVRECDDGDLMMDVQAE